MYVTTPNPFFELEACPDKFGALFGDVPAHPSSTHPQWCVSSNLRAPSRSRFYTEMAELYFDWDFRMVGDEFFLKMMSHGDVSRFSEVAVAGCWLID